MINLEAIEEILKKEISDKVNMRDMELEIQCLTLQRDEWRTEAQSWMVKYQELERKMNSAQ